MELDLGLLARATSKRTEQYKQALSPEYEDNILEDMKIYKQGGRILTGKWYVLIGRVREGKTRVGFKVRRGRFCMDTARQHPY
jgi:hypothetical protein